MAYCDLDDLKLHLPDADLIELTDDSGSAIDEDVVAAAILAADELIDGYTRGRYSLPFSPVPGLIAKLSVRLAIYNLYDRKMSLKIPERLAEGHKEDLALLDRLRRGEVVLDADAAPSAGGATGDYRTNKTSDDRIFTSDVLDLMP